MKANKQVTAAEQLEELTSAELTEVSGGYGYGYGYGYAMPSYPSYGYRPSYGYGYQRNYGYGYQHSYGYSPYCH